jgi:hypothetical protein
MANYQINDSLQGHPLLPYDEYVYDDEFCVYENVSSSGIDRV